MPRPSPVPNTEALQVPHLLGRALQTAWRRGLSREPVLEPGALIDAAARHEGVRPPEGSWLEALERLAHDLREHAELNALGRTIAHGQLVGILRQRIRAAALWRQHPAILDHAIKAPVIILGHMRSGTTRLQRLLACDPRFAYTRLHESLSPLGSGIRPVAAAAAVRALLHVCNRQLGTIHPTGPFAPEEEFGLHAFAFHGAMLEAQWKLPDFARWSEQRDLADGYREFRQLLQTLRWRRGNGPQQVQLLKAPQFMQDLGALLQAFPDARVIVLHRDPREVVASSASLVWQQQRVQSDAADPHWVGHEWLRKTRLRQQRAADALARHPQVPKLDVHYEAVNGNWRAEVERIYAFLNLDLQPATLDKMRKVAKRASHKGHLYSLEQFGLDDRTVAEALD